MSGEKNPVDLVRQRGDILDADKRFSRRVGSRTITSSQLLFSVTPAIGGSWGFNIPSPYELQELGVHMAVSNQGFLATSTLASTAYYLDAKRRNTKRVEERSELLERPLGDTAEPIDIFRAKKNKKSLEIRWYGMDQNWQDTENPQNPAITAERMKTMADLADEHAIDRISIGTWQLDNLSINYEDAGSVHAGASYITNQKKTRIKLADTMVDDQVLQTTPEQLRSLADQVEAAEIEVDSSSALDDLVAQLRNVELGRRYARFKNTRTAQSLAEFQTYARNLLEQSIGDDSYSTSKKDHLGIPQPAKVAGYNRINGRNIVNHSVWRDSSGNQGHEFGGKVDILRRFNTPSIDTLIESLIGKKLVDGRMKDRATAAIYLMSLDTSVDGSQERVVRSSADQSTADDTIYPTTTLQLHSNANLRTRRLRVKGSDEAKDRLSYSYRKHWTLRKTGAAAMITVGTAGGVLVGTSVGGIDKDITTKAEKNAQDILNESGPVLESEHKAKLEKEYRKQLGNYAGFVDVMKKVRDFEYAVSGYVASAWVATFGNQIADLMTSDFISKNWDLNIKDLPEGAEGFLRQSGLNGFIGDVPGDNERNKTIFRIESPKGLSTEGYWYDNIYDNATVSTGQPPLEATLNYGSTFVVGIPIETLNLPYQEADIAKTDYDYVVSTSFVGGNGKTSTWIPVIQGGEVVAAAYVDQNDPRKRIPLKILFSPNDGTYSVDAAKRLEDEMLTADLNNPQLQYYIKMTGEKTIHNTDHFSFQYSDQDAQQIAVQLKAALGLGPSATNQDVYNEIKKRNYSFTPIRDQNLPSGVNTYDKNDSVQQSVLKIGTLLAQLESLNCNLASTLQMLATANGGPDVYQQARGYHDNGDGKLVQGEAHAWLIDKDSDIVDPTPSNNSPSIGAPDDSSLENSAITRNDLEKWGGILVGAAILISAYRRRNALMQQIDKRLDEQAHADLLHPDAPESIAHIMTAMYGGDNPRQSVTLAAVQASTQSESLAKFIHDDMTPRQVIDKRNEQGAALNKKRQKSIRRVIRGAKRLNRQIN